MLHALKIIQSPLPSPFNQDTGCYSGATMALQGGTQVVLRWYTGGTRWYNGTSRCLTHTSTHLKSLHALVPSLLRAPSTQFFNCIFNYTVLIFIPTDDDDEILSQLNIKNQKKFWWLLNYWMLVALII